MTTTKKPRKRRCARQVCRHPEERHRQGGIRSDCFVAACPCLIFIPPKPRKRRETGEESRDRVRAAFADPLGGNQPPLSVNVPKRETPEQKARALAKAAGLKFWLERSSNGLWWTRTTMGRAIGYDHATTTEIALWRALARERGLKP